MGGGALASFEEKSDIDLRWEELFLVPFFSPVFLLSRAREGPWGAEGFLTKCKCVLPSDL